MKTNKAVENVEITPSKKKLTQARLPFKLISEDASTPVAPPTRKRKLSVDGTEPAPKGKICKENNELDDLVVISDDECKDNQKLEKEAKVMNPFVKLVDTARKKKLQKAKTPKKRKSRKSTSKQIESTETKNETEQGDADDVEMMDVDTENQEQTGNEQKSPKASPKSKKTEIETNNKASNDDLNDVVELEDSNDCTDVQKPNETEKESDINTEVKEAAPVTPRTTRKSMSETDTEKSNESEPAPKTPVRKAKDGKDKANTSLPAKLNESVSSPSTPKRSSRSSSVTNSLNDSVSESASTPAANLTPKQMQKKLESAKKREEREKDKQEREKKRQEEKEEKARQRQEKDDAKKREREEKEEQKRKEKEEKEKQKELEKKLREEKEEQKKKEREEKEEQRRKEKEARDEEKRKKQEALELEKQEQELKKKKAAEAFVNFFVPKQKEKEPKAIVSQNSILSSFTIKADMRLAPLIRVELSDMQKIDMDKLISDQKLVEKDLYLKNLKKEGVKIGRSGKTWPLTDKEEDDDVMIVEDELPAIEGAEEVLACEEATREKLRPKLFSFHENKRPPYWGTWRKKSAFVTARRPFGQEKQLDYDVDSDEDWEEEQEGESLDGSVAGDDDEPDDDYEVDNEVFVPHGYLSDEEATMDEEEDKDNVLSLSPETQKARLKNLEDEFESEMKKPTEKLKPRLYGLIWETKDGGKPEKCIDALWNYFGKLSMIMDDAVIDSLLQPPSEPQEPEKKKVKKKKLAEGEQQSPKSEKKKKAKPEKKETKKAKSEPKQETKKNQPGINSFLNKLKST
ncbi:chromatin assembly factor 1 subunit A-like [Cydia strobilella]|uniref:chromatin assembly factor 1 subunit A-like n=1 Tax=Cydia strobilella TaxID=1100964 RepID=UPI00300555AA